MEETKSLEFLPRIILLDFGQIRGTAAKYFEETIKMLPQKPDPILFEQVFGQLSTFSCIHPANSQLSAT